MAQEATGRTGSCLCGAVQLRFAPGAKPRFANLCHCSTCRKSTGSAFACLAMFKISDVTYQTPADDPEALRTYVDRSPESGSVLERSFCAHCGSNMRIRRRPPPPDPVTGQEHPLAADSRDYLVVPQGVMDPLDGDEDVLTPTLELFCVRRSAWLGDVQGAKRFAKLPEGF